MGGRADRQGVAVIGAEARSGVELQLRPGRVDEVVEGDEVLAAGFSRSGELDLHLGVRRVAPSLGVEGDGLRLVEDDALLLVDRCEREEH